MRLAGLVVFLIGVWIFGNQLPNLADHYSNTDHLSKFLTSISGAQLSALVVPALSLSLMFLVLVIALADLKSLTGLGPGIRDSLKEREGVQGFIAFGIIFAFVLAAITGQQGGASLLKDLALVVVGFYFGTKK